MHLSEAGNGNEGNNMAPSPRCLSKARHVHYRQEGVQSRIMGLQALAEKDVERRLKGRRKRKQIADVEILVVQLLVVGHLIDQRILRPPIDRHSDFPELAHSPHH